MKPLALLLLSALAAFPQIAVDWDQAKPEILRHYRSLVQIDSTAGNETKVVDYLRTDRKSTRLNSSHT